MVVLSAEVTAVVVVAGAQLTMLELLAVDARHPGAVIPAVAGGRWLLARLSRRAVTQSCVLQG